MKNILTIAFMLLSTISIFAQQNTSEDEYYNYKLMIGASAGSTSGVGLSARYIMDEHGFTVTAAPLLYKEGRNQSGILNVGFSYNYYIRTNDFVDFSLKVSANTIYGSIIENNRSTRINLGIGPEINFHLLPELDIDIHLGYGLYNATESLNSSLSASIGCYYNLYL